MDTKTMELQEQRGEVAGVKIQLTREESARIQRAVHPAERRATLDAILAERRAAAASVPTLSDDELENLGISTARSLARVAERNERWRIDAENRLEAERQAVREKAGLGDLLPRLADLEGRITALEAGRAKR